MTLSGSCMCGEIAYSSSSEFHAYRNFNFTQLSPNTKYHTGKPKVTALCHCVDCQKV